MVRRDDFSARVGEIRHGAFNPYQPQNPAHPYNQPVGQVDGAPARIPEPALRPDEEPFQGEDDESKKKRAYPENQVNKGFPKAHPEFPYSSHKSALFFNRYSTKALCPSRASAGKSSAAFSPETFKPMHIGGRKGPVRLPRYSSGIRSSA